MLRKLFIFILALMLLAACGTSPEGPSSDEETIDTPADPENPADTPSTPGTPGGGGGGGGGSTTADTVINIDSFTEDQKTAWKGKKIVKIESTGGSIALSGLTPGNSYGIYLNSSDYDPGRSYRSSRASSANITATKGDLAEVIPGSVYMITPETDGECSFTVSGGSAEIGIADFPISDSTSGMKVDSKTDVPYRKDESGIYYEKFFSFNISELSNPSEVLLKTTGWGSGSGFTNYGIVAIDGKPLEERTYGFQIFDFSGKSNLTLFLSVGMTNILSESRGEELHLVSPIEIENNQKTNIMSLVDSYKIDQSKLNPDTEYVIEITPSKELGTYLYAIINNNANPRYKDGTRRPYLFPLNLNSWESDPILIYMGKPEGTKPFYFDSDIYPNNPEEITDFGTIELRAYKEGDYQKPETVKLTGQNSSCKFEINPDDKSRPTFIFTAEDKHLTNLEVSLHFYDDSGATVKTENDTLRVMCSHGPEAGFSSYSNYSGQETITVKDRDFLEYVQVRKFPVNAASGQIDIAYIR